MRNKVLRELKWLAVFAVVSGVATAFFAAALFWLGSSPVSDVQVHDTYFVFNPAASFAMLLAAMLISRYSVVGALTFKGRNPIARRTVGVGLLVLLAFTLGWLWQEFQNFSTYVQPAAFVFVAWAIYVFLPYAVIAGGLLICASMLLLSRETN